MFWMSQLQYTVPVYLFSNFHLEEEKNKKKALNEGLMKGLEVPARPGFRV